MSAYGYIIVKTLILSWARYRSEVIHGWIKQRRKSAWPTLGVKNEQNQDRYAEGWGGKDRLHGVGIAEQRKAIVDGLADSIKRG